METQLVVTCAFVILIWEAFRYVIYLLWQHMTANVVKSTLALNDQNFCILVIIDMILFYCIGRFELVKLFKKIFMHRVLHDVICVCAVSVLCLLELELIGCRTLPFVPSYSEYRTSVRLERIFWKRLLLRQIDLEEANLLALWKLRSEKPEDYNPEKCQLGCAALLRLGSRFLCLRQGLKFRYGIIGSCTLIILAIIL